jgi:protein involved in polysaccharide export with SLBB domain
VLVEGYLQGEFLQNPRVIIRSLDAATVKIQVTGAVNRPGYVDLNRSDRSAYAAIVSAGGLSKTAGTQVAITRAPTTNPVELDSTSDRHYRQTKGSTGHPRTAERSLPDREAIPEIEPLSPSLDPVNNPAQRANMGGEVSVPSATSSHSVNARPGRGLFSIDVSTKRATGGDSAAEGMFQNTEPAVEAEPVNETPNSDSYIVHLPAQPATGSETESQTVWYDVSLARDRDTLKLSVLSEGDIVTIKPAAPPLRIGGIVLRPGAYPLPPGRSLNLWQAIELAGGVQDSDTPVKISIDRPASDGRPAKHWQVSVPSYAQHPTASPLVEPGDELHVAPTTGSKIKRVVRNVWSKP